MCTETKSDSVICGVELFSSRHLVCMDRLLHIVKKNNNVALSVSLSEHDSRVFV